jgi:hypothetical protein
MTVTGTFAKTLLTFRTLNASILLASFLKPAQNI